jgi:thiamine-monophosphate kinase
MTEKELIKKYFHFPLHSKNVALGIGDDAAILTVPEGYSLALSVDTLNEDIHFLKNTDPHNLAYKAVAVNVSDLAAMGAKPLSILLSLSLPHIDETWLATFSKGLQEALETYEISLIGGDLNKGPLSITIEAQGFIKPEQAFLRSNAKVGDLIVVSNTLGGARVALAALQGKITLSETALHCVRDFLEKPQPPVALSQSLLGKVHCALDLSDGLHHDLSRICEASHVGAKINVEALPIPILVQEILGNEKAIDYAISGGDDYQLCFTINKKHQDFLQALSKEYRLSILGEIIEGNGIQYYQQEKRVEKNSQGFEHFN